MTVRFAHVAVVAVFIRKGRMFYIKWHQKATSRVFLRAQNHIVVKPLPPLCSKSSFSFPPFCSLTKKKDLCSHHFMLYAFSFVLFPNCPLFFLSFSGILFPICFTNCPPALWCFHIDSSFYVTHLSSTKKQTNKTNPKKNLWKTPTAPQGYILCVSLFFFFFFLFNSPELLCHMRFNSAFFPPSFFVFWVTFAKTDPEKKIKSTF